MQPDEYWAGSTKKKVKITDPKMKAEFERAVSLEFAKRAERMTKSLKIMPKDLKKSLENIRTEARENVRNRFLRSSAFDGLKSM